MSREAGSAQPVNVGNEFLDQVRAQLDLADTCVGLGIGNPQPGAGRVMKPDLSQQHVAKLACAKAGAAERRDDRASADVVPSCVVTVRRRPCLVLGSVFAAV